ncbi:MAG: ribonuclease P protein component [Myxococcales bacterium]|nr:MAG: ribonuclease P protein component [Myxococcales bacterium]
MPDPAGPFRRSDRLLRSSEYSKVGREGRRVAEPAFVLLVSTREDAGDDPVQRLGITMSRKVGPAVVRNRVKRRVREWFRRTRPMFRSGIDVVVIGRSAAAGLSDQDTKGILCRLADKANATRS